MNVSDNSLLISKPQLCSCSKILIVDDNDFNIFSLQTLLQYRYGLTSDYVSLTTLFSSSFIFTI